MDENVSDFFDRQADDYHTIRAGMQFHHIVTARKIEEGLTGKVLSIGGLWNRAGLASLACDVTVLDVSQEMLSRYAALGLQAVHGDALKLEFPPASFDHVVLPLVLHHITDGSARRARSNVHRVLAQVSNVLKPGGKVWISEFTVAPLVYGIELLAAPFVRRALSVVSIPLVVMHSARMYVNALSQTGYQDIKVQPIKSHDASAVDWIQPIIGLKWLWVPRFLYPIRPTLISAQRITPNRDVGVKTAQVSRS